jgi:hypothetical protein
MDMEVNLDLRIAGTIDLGDSGSSERPRIEAPPRGSRSLEWERRRGGNRRSAHGESQIPGASRREKESAAKKTRQAIAAVKQAIRTEDAQRVRREARRLKDAAMHLEEAVNRSGAATETDEERSSGVVIDAEIEETAKRDQKPG